MAVEFRDVPLTGGTRWESPAVKTGFVGCMSTGGSAVTIASEADGTGVLVGGSGVDGGAGVVGVGVVRVHWVGWVGSVDWVCLVCGIYYGPGSDWDCRVAWLNVGNSSNNHIVIMHHIVAIVHLSITKLAATCTEEHQN